MAQGSKHQLAKKHHSQAVLVLNRLFKEALRDPDKPMTRTQMRAAEVAMRKIIPDLKAIEHAMDEATREAFCLVLNAQPGTKTSTD